MFENKEQFRLCIDETDKKIYEYLTEEGVLKGRNRNKFIFAMAYGFRNNASLPLKNRDTGGYWRFYESAPEERALVFSVALKEYPDLTFKDENELKAALESAERYAHGGIRLLKNLYDSLQMGKFWKKLEKDLFDLYKEKIET